MSDTVIRVENLSKKYVINHCETSGSYSTVRESLSAGIRSLKHRIFLKKENETKTEEFWALKEASFEVRRGEVVGIIGRNGAGKSTLLKLLSRITEPTRGRISIEGRVASLLEVGTGFHPELTGRENIYLNGSILGMSRKEVKGKFNEIVAFAEIERFLDTPVKRYSSGMYVRLAFAVAAHLDPEVLIIDEVLAVGDKPFQDKCIGKMKNVANSGRTVLCVSHQLGTLRSLCSSGIVLEKGMVTFKDRIEESLEYYLKQTSQLADTKVSERTDRKGTGQSKIIEINVTDSSTSGEPMTGRPTKVRIKISNPSNGLVCIFTILSNSGQPIFNTSSPLGLIEKWNNPAIIECELKCLLLLTGTYRINIAIMNNQVQTDHVEAACVFSVSEGVIEGNVVKSNPHSLVYLPHNWSSLQRNTSD